MLTTLLLLIISADTLNLTLDQAVGTALRVSPTSADARLDSVDGRSKYLQGWAEVIPTPSASAGLGWSNSQSFLDSTKRSTSHSVSFSVGASQVIFDPNVVGAVAQGYAGRQLSYYSSWSKLNTLVWNVRTAYFGLQKAYALLDVSNSAVQLAQNNYDLAQVKLKLGQSTGIDLLRAQTNLQQARLNLMSAETGLLTASEAFKGQLGMTDEVIIKPVAIDTNPPTAAFASRTDYWQAVDTGNPSLQLARLTVKVAEIGKKVAYGRMLPSLSFSISERYSDSMLPSASNPWSRNDGLSWGFNLSLPIINVPQILLGINSAKIALERARISLQSSEITIRQTATSAWLSYEQTARQVAYAAENLRLNQELYRQAQEQYRLGQLTQLDLFTVETGLIQARISYLSGLADVQSDLAQLYYLLGK